MPDTHTTATLPELKVTWLKFMSDSTVFICNITKLHMIDMYMLKKSCFFFCATVKTKENPYTTVCTRTFTLGNVFII